MTEENRLAETSGTDLAQTKECPFCAEKINAIAKKCKHCGETIDVTLRIAEEARRASNNAGGNIVVTTALNNTQSGLPVPPYALKSRLAYQILALLFGSIGLHNFYAGYGGKGLIQLILGITVAGAIVSYPWALVEIFTVKCDGRGLQMA